MSSSRESRSNSNENIAEENSPEESESENSQSLPQSAENLYDPIFQEFFDMFEDLKPTPVANLNVTTINKFLFQREEVDTNSGNILRITTEAVIQNKTEIPRTIEYECLDNAPRKYNGQDKDSDSARAEKLIPRKSIERQLDELSQKEATVNKAANRGSDNSSVSIHSDYLVEKDKWYKTEIDLINAIEDDISEISDEIGNIFQICINQSETESVASTSSGTRQR